MNHNKLIKGFKWSTLGNVGMAIFQLSQIAILTRFLTKDIFGLVAMAVLVVNFTNIFVEMGITSAILHVKKATKREYSSLYWLSFFISLLLYFIIFILAEFVSNFYNEPQLTEVVRILGLNIVFIAIGQQFRTMLQKNMEFDKITKVNLLSYFVSLIVAILLAYFNFGIYSLIYSTLISSLIASLLFLFLCFSKYPIIIYFKFKDTKKFLNVGVYSLGSNILDFFSREIDLIVIGKILSTESLGVYSLVKQISLKLYSMLMPIIFNVLTPFLTSLNNHKEKMELTFLKIVYYVVNITFPIYLIIILAAKEILLILYGEKYQYAYVTLVCLAIFQANFSLVKPLGSLQIATGKTNIGFYWTIFRNILTFSMLLFINWLGFNTVENIAFSLATLSVFLLLATWSVQINNMTDISFKNYLNQFYKPLIIIIIISFLKIFILDNLIEFTNHVLTGLVKIIIGLTFYLFLLLIWDKKQLIKKFNLILYDKGR